MSLSSSTLLILQKVGAAAFAADTKLKADVKDYSQRVHEAMVANPDGQKSDALFANWKVVMRLSQAMSGIEGELKKLFDAACTLTADAPAALVKVSRTPKPAKNSKPTATLKRTHSQAAKVSAKPVAVQLASTKPINSEAVVVAKVSAKAALKPALKKTKTTVQAKATAKSATKTKAKSAVVAAPTGPVALGANPTKVLRHLETLLNAQDFTVISQTVVSKETGIPLGSMTAATKKLLSTGHLLAGPSGSFKLAHAPTAVS